MNQQCKVWYSATAEQTCQGLASALFRALGIAWQVREKSQVCNKSVHAVFCLESLIH